MTISHEYLSNSNMNTEEAVIEILHVLIDIRILLEKQSKPIQPIVVSGGDTGTIKAMVEQVKILQSEGKL